MLKVHGSTHHHWALTTRELFYIFLYVDYNCIFFLLEAEVHSSEASQSQTHEENVSGE